jgi:YD repeat-containing protein
MLKFKFTFCFIAVWLAMIPSYGQVDPSLDALRTVVPPSPNASSLGKFGEWPVSLYTGLPSVDIPIYTVKGRSLSVPISIGYHSAGIRVGEIASWVGLGWALNAGGCITRAVQGLPDEQGGFFTVGSNYTNPNNLCGAPINDNTFMEIVGAAAQGNEDTQEDSYNLSILGRSYRIVISSDTTAFTLPASNIKITSNFLQTGVSSPSTSTWTVLLEDGTQLLFGGPTTDSTAYVEMTDNSRFHGADFPSAWYLQTMTSSSGESITFTYSPTNITQETHFTQSDYVEYWTSTPVLGFGSPSAFMNATSIGGLTETQTINQLSLKTIESDLTRVYFIPSTTARMDLSGGVALSQIQVLSKSNNTYVENWLFNQVYTQCVTGNELGGSSQAPSYWHYRLKLMSLTKEATDNSASEVWSFTYNPTLLPSRMSFAQDYWGFYNGATTNTSILPTVPFNPTVCHLAGSYGPYPFTNEGFLNGLVQNLSPNPSYMTAESLTQIAYPTGGHTIFNFEPNSTPSTQEVFVDTSISMHFTDNESMPYVGSVSYSFTLTKPEYVFFNYSATISQAVLNDITSAKVSMAITNSEGDGISNSTVGVTSGSANAWVNLYNPGSYTLTLSTNVPADEFTLAGYDVIASVDFRFFNSHGVQNINKMLGGLRLNNLQEYDGINANPINSKYYVYDSAFIINPVDTVNDYLTYQSKVFPPGVDENQYIYELVTRNSSTKYSIGSIQGGTVGYGKVTTYDGLNGANGYTVSSFTCDPITQDNLRTSLSFPYPPNDQREWRNGLLINENTFTAGGQLVGTVQNTYGFNQTSQYDNFKVGYSTINQAALSPPCTGYTLGFCGTQPQCYPITNEEVEHVSSTQIAYDVSNGNAVSATTNYFYDDALNMQPTRTVSLDSKEDTVVTYSRSPFEISDINSSIPLTSSAIAALDTMIARNMVGKPVETERYVKSVLTYKALTNYLVQPTGLVLPNNVMVQNAPYPIDTRLNLLEYDNYGNLLQQAKANDVNHNYIYDYSANYPIAEVVNADSTSIAYTSFESNGTGGWTLGTGSVDSTTAITGAKSYNLSGSVTRTGLNSATMYIVSYWTENNSAFSVSGTISGYPVQGKSETINGNKWTLYVHKVTGQSTITLTGSGHIDELRLYPSTAQMTTYTYSPLVGMTSQTDVGNRVTYYEYDGLARLKRIRDQDYNILKTYEYQYQVPAGCNGCQTVAMETFLGTNTIGYPVGVFDIHGNLVGNAVGASAYVSLWNSDTADARIGTLSTGNDSLHFNIVLHAGQMLPASVTGCRYYQYDLPWYQLDGVRYTNGEYVDFGDGAGMHLGKGLLDTPKVMAPNTSFVVINDFYYYEGYLIHTYTDNDTSVKTITFYHNDDKANSALDNALSPATSLLKVRNLRGNVPQNTNEIGGSSYQQPSALTVSGITNWNNITSVTYFDLQTGDGGANDVNHVNYAQDFMQNNKDLDSIMTQGCSDTTFKLSLLKSNWNTYFTNLYDLEIFDNQWNREDISALTNLWFLKFYSTSTNGIGTNGVPVIDNIINQIYAGAGQNRNNGVINITWAGFDRTNASVSAYNFLKNKGWTIYINGVYE